MLMLPASWLIAASDTDFMVNLAFDLYRIPETGNRIICHFNLKLVELYFRAVRLTVCAGIFEHETVFGASAAVNAVIVVCDSADIPDHIGNLLRINGTDAVFVIQHDIVSSDIDAVVLAEMSVAPEGQHFTV